MKANHTPGLATDRVRHTPRTWVRLLALAAIPVLGACDDSPSESNRASLIRDATGDIRAAFTAAPRNADLDVVRAEVSYDGTSFVFESTSAGPIGTTPNAQFVWGVNAGAGTLRFNDIAAGVRFDMVVVIRPDGTGRVTDLTAIPPAATDLPAGSVSMSGGTLTARVPASLLPSRGRTPERYTVTLWPRVGVGNNIVQISDFAPDNSSAPVRDMR
jgi:hypothetical protein